MTKPKLSVCIATYNRAEYISETLESIIPQITNEIEMYLNRPNDQKLFAEAKIKMMEPIIQPDKLNLNSP